MASSPDGGKAIVASKPFAAAPITLRMKSSLYMSRLPDILKHAGNPLALRLHAEES